MTAPGFVEGVLIPPQICLFLERSFDFDRLRGSISTDDLDVHFTLREIHRVAMTYLRRADATPRTTEPRPEIEWFTPGQAASRLGVAADTIRRAIREERLPAEKHNDRWRIHPTELDTYRRRT